MACPTYTHILKYIYFHIQLVKPKSWKPKRIAIQFETIHRNNNLMIHRVHHLRYIQTWANLSIEHTGNNSNIRYAFFLSSSSLDWSKKKSLNIFKWKQKAYKSGYFLNVPPFTKGQTILLIPKYININNSPGINKIHHFKQQKFHRIKNKMY